MRALIFRGAAVSGLLGVALAVAALAGCQDAAASNPERDTHMGDVHAAAEQAPPLPPAPSNAVPTPLSVAMPAMAPPPPPAAPPAPSASAAADAGPHGHIAAPAAKPAKPATH